MTHHLHEQYDLTREGLMKEMDKLDPIVIDIQPNGFNNTIHWHIGHILTVTEQFLFGFPEQSETLPKNYVALFGYGSKPADWPEDVPDVDTLAKQLFEQLKRINQIPAEQFATDFPEPVMGQSTFGGLFGMAAYHEAYHIGQIHAMQFSAKENK